MDGHGEQPGLTPGGGAGRSENLQGRGPEEGYRGGRPTGGHRPREGARGAQRTYRGGSKGRPSLAFSPVATAGPITRHSHHEYINGDTHERVFDNSNGNPANFRPQVGFCRVFTTQKN